MAHLPTIFSDLAMILLVAGITTIIFRKLNQPLVLGYIIAGFITGPHFDFFPTVSDTVSVSTWSETGVIFLLFALGLEFSFYKLKSVGTTAFIGAAVEILGLLAFGYAAGHLLGWNDMDSLFLGGMLSMSSTTIIIKAFDDLKLKGQHFTEMVFGILIVEDIAGIVMMVLLSTLAAASADVSTLQLLLSILRLLFFLVLWFVIGMYLVPSFYKYAERYMNDETLVVASIGLCLGMVVLATHLGFSSALGAFIMGSLIAEAPAASRIEHLVAPIKDLFGAVFFVSVGMLVNPTLLLEHWLPVAILTLVAIFGKLIFSSGGVLLSGQSLATSLHCGFSLAQIGEFSFIIASLGMSLGVISGFLYPIIVAVSVITTFSTPFCIMAATPVCSFLERVLPASLLKQISRYTSDNNTESNTSSDWQLFLRSYSVRMLIFITLLFAIAIFAQYFLEPLLDSWFSPLSANIFTGLLTITIMSPFLRALLVNHTRHPELFSTLWFKKRTNHLPLIVLLLFKILTASIFLYFIFSELLELNELVSAVATLIVAYFISASNWLMGEYLRIESRFLVNLNAQHMLRHRQTLEAEGKTPLHGWFDEELHLGYFRLESGSAVAGLSLSTLALRENFGCNIIQIALGDHFYDMPNGDFVIPAQAQLLIIGTLPQFHLLGKANISKSLGLSVLSPPVCMKDFMTKNDYEKSPDKAFFPCAITINDASPLLGQALRNANIRNKWHCLVIGIERGNYTITTPHVSLVFEKNDLLWLLGKQKMINQLIRDKIL